MRAFSANLLGMGLALVTFAAGATPVTIAGSATASEFAERPTGFLGVPVPGPFDPLSASFELSYEDTLAPLDGTLDVALDSISLSIGGAVYDAMNASAVLRFAAGDLVGVTVGGDANGGPTILQAATDDFLFSNDDGVQLFQYTVAGNSGSFSGLFETLFIPGLDPDIGEVSVVFAPAQQVPAPAPLALISAAMMLLVGRTLHAGRGLP